MLYFCDAHSPCQAGCDNGAGACSSKIVKMISEQESRVACFLSQPRFDLRQNFQRKYAAYASAVQCKKSFHVTASVKSGITKQGKPFKDFACERILRFFHCATQARQALTFL